MNTQSRHSDSPTQGKSLIAQADALMNLNRDREAIQILQRALQFAPQDARLLCRMSLAHLHLNDLLRCLQFSHEAVTADPLEEWGHRLRSIALLRLGRKQEALLAGEQARALAPDEPLVLYTLASAQRANDKLREARQTAERMRELAPDDALSHEALALVAVDENRYEEVERHCRKALEINPNSYSAMNNLGLSLLRRKRKREAIECFHQAAQLNPLGDVARDNLQETVKKYLPGIPFLVTAAVLLRLAIDKPALGLFLFALIVSAYLLFRHYRVSRLSPQVRAFLKEEKRWQKINRAQSRLARRHKFIDKSLLNLSLITTIATILLLVIWGSTPSIRRFSFGYVVFSAILAATLFGIWLWRWKQGKEKDDW